MQQAHNQTKENDALVVVKAFYRWIRVININVLFGRMFSQNPMGNIKLPMNVFTTPSSRLDYCPVIPNIEIL